MIVKSSVDTIQRMIRLIDNRFEYEKINDTYLDLSNNGVKVFALTIIGSFFYITEYKNTKSPMDCRLFRFNRTNFLTIING